MPTSAYRKDDPASIQEMFSSIARSYDRGNAAVSFQLFRRWNRRLIQEVLLWPDPPRTLLDLCCGTGEITFTYLRELHRSPHAHHVGQITLMDFAQGMLHEAERKAVHQRSGCQQLRFLPGDAQEICLPSQSMDAVVIAYGIRNVANPVRCLNEVYRVLKPGGRLGILELTRPDNPLLRAGHAVYLRAVVPLLGRLVTANGAAYQYLRQSVENFISVDELHHNIRTAGFHHSWRKPLTGGIATLFFGQKGAAHYISECCRSDRAILDHDCRAITA
jgi:demethylmenaquinone methyltransferase/2-methoxy-6-polyprenyl-1,4-benzoquinol methylase